MKRRAPTTKAEFYRRFQRGEFGNRPRLWATAELLAADDYGGLVTARDMVPGGVCHYGVPAEVVRAALRGEAEVRVLPGGKGDQLPGAPDWLAFDPRAYRYNEAMPDHLLVLQGNVLRTRAGLVLEFSEVRNVGHRDAVRQPLVRTERGLAALVRLRERLCPGSLDDLLVLLDEYATPHDDSCSPVVEFSSYATRVGVLPNRNTVFWEVRAY